MLIVTTVHLRWREDEVSLLGFIFALAFSIIECWIDLLLVVLRKPCTLSEHVEDGLEVSFVQGGLMRDVTIGASVVKHVSAAENTIFIRTFIVLLVVSVVLTLVFIFLAF